MSQQMKALLGIMLVLVITRFVIQPWAESLDERFLQLQSAQRKLVKAENLAASESELLAARDQMLSQLGPIQEKISSAKSSDDFSLSIQTQLTNFFTERQVSVDLFNWTGDRTLEGSEFKVARVSLRVSAPQYMLASALLTLQRDNPNISVEQTAISVVDGVTFDKPVNIDVELDILFRLTP